MIRWRGRDYSKHEQVANACDDFVDLTPASEIPAQLTRAKWDAWRPGQEIPLIGEIRYAEREEEC
jgi:hypothetical protein